jgi:MFS family permease
MFEEDCTRLEATPNGAARRLSPAWKRPFDVLALRRVRALLVLGLCFGCVALDNTKLVAAMPTFARTYGESAALHWVVESGLLVYASLLLLGGSLSERFGARRTLLVGLAIFAAGSVFAAECTTVGTLIVARGVVGLGAALITPSTLGTLKHLFDERERPLAIAVWTSAYGVFATLGPVISGWVLARFAPPSVMLVNLPFVLVAMAASSQLVPADLPRRLVPLDVTSTVLAFSGTAALLYAILEGATYGFDARAVRLSAVSAVGLYGALVYWTRRAPHPLLDPALFRRVQFRAALIVILLGYLTFSGVAYVVAQYFQVARGHSAFEAGLRTMPLTLSMLAGNFAAAPVMKWLGTDRALVACALLATFGLVALTLGSGVPGDLWVCAAQIPFGMGCGGVFVNATEAVIGSVPSERAGTAAAINEGAFEFGGVLGVAVLGAVLGSPLVAPALFAANAGRALWVGCATVGLAAGVAATLAMVSAKSNG